MIIHWRAHLNSVQNAVGYMIPPTMPTFFSAPSGSNFVLNVSDALGVLDSIGFSTNLGFGDVFDVSDSMKLEISNWIRRMRVTDNLFEVILLRTSGARAFRDDGKYSITILRVD